MKKNILLAALCILFLTSAMAQNNVGVGTTTPNASAALDVQSTTQGMLVPRMTAAQRGMIATPATGLLVYQTDATAGFYFYNGTTWTSLSGGGSGDNLGNHTATQALNMNSNNITNVNTITASKVNLQEFVFPTFNNISTNNATLTSTQLDATGYTFIKIAGAIGPSTINGIAGGTHGKIIHIIAESLYTLVFNSASETCVSCKINGLYSGNLTYNASRWVATLLWESTSNSGQGGWSIIAYTQ